MQTLKLVKARKDVPPVGILKDNYYYIDLNSLHIDQNGNAFINVYTFLEEFIMPLFIETFTTVI